jgi:hypothetical protein
MFLLVAIIVTRMRAITAFTPGCTGARIRRAGATAKSTGSRPLAWNRDAGRRTMPRAARFMEGVDGVNLKAGDRQEWT